MVFRSVNETNGIRMKQATAPAHASDTGGPERSVQEAAAAGLGKAQSTPASSVRYLGWRRAPLHTDSG
ncbi:hypothetical protein GCM10010842_19580 [Deinococcus daejeonensis]|uniref:Uncharacterized protein n=1 Tax=Deinococcus daejeonensis TaxID=1007098 RepID=A0ABQ2J1I9_9DEIO|nr:hypothetical protein GCM10010842_19580 [Deinococcus daejeonensis]